ncbi:hypothetical protein ACWDUM_07740 [Rhodococcus sp. NPDC003322]
MREWTTRRVLAVCALVVVATAGVAGCSDSDDSAADSAATVATSVAATTSAAAEASEATTKAITDTYVAFFDGTNTPAARAALVESGESFLAPLEGMAASPNGQTSATVSSVTMTGADTADVKYTIYMGGAPVLPDQTGQAVEVDGQWKVAATTFCALLAIQGGAEANPACQ